MPTEHLPFAGGYLTPHERCLISALICLKKDFEAALKLGIALSTLNNEKHVLVKRFGISRKHELVILALKFGFDDDGTFHPVKAKRLHEKELRRRKKEEKNRKK